MWRGGWRRNIGKVSLERIFELLSEITFWRFPLDPDGARENGIIRQEFGDLPLGYGFSAFPEGSPRAGVQVSARELGQLGRQYGRGESILFLEVERLPNIGEQLGSE